MSATHVAEARNNLTRLLSDLLALPNLPDDLRAAIGDHVGKKLSALDALNPETFQRLYPLLMELSEPPAAEPEAAEAPAEAAAEEAPVEAAAAEPAAAEEAPTEAATEAPAEAAQAEAAAAEAPAEAQAEPAAEAPAVEAAAEEPAAKAPAAEAAAEEVIEMPGAIIAAQAVNGLDQAAAHGA